MRKMPPLPDPDPRERVWLHFTKHVWQSS